MEALCVRCFRAIYTPGGCTAPEAVASGCSSFKGKNSIIFALPNPSATNTGICFGLIFRIMIDAIIGSPTL